MLPYSKVNIKYAVDHLKDPIHVWFSTYYWYINILWVTTLYFINPALVGFWVAVIGITTVKMNLVNNAGHSTTAVNVPWLAYIFLDGEFWHANHHDDPQNWNYSKEWYQFDFGAVVISTLCALGLATI
jgi:fatty-acid desaturase